MAMQKRHNRRRRKINQFAGDKIKKINYKDINTLKKLSQKEVKFFQEESLVTQLKHNVNLQLLSNVQDTLHFYHTHKINF